ncbi:MAG: ABC transporter ATP-binding protein [Chitinophagales bacterium]|nr:ABC transporter ATP-binding protein [Chitinophagaceae bacterium]MCB9064414.1 ABC transporter ATP-binding protein [Chitinophagales bacterium]
MKISLKHISKRFQKHWIFKDVNTVFLSSGKYAILGPNGSGKSTLLRVIAGMQSPSTGELTYELNDEQVDKDKLFNHISFCAPAQEIVEEFTLTEFLKFHFSFKKIIAGLDIPHIIETIGLQHAQDKPIEEYSSGMKQRVKLAQAIFTDTPVLLLDEPCTNLDEHGVQQYREWIDKYCSNRLVIVASNDVREHYFCTERISIDDYK